MAEQEVAAPATAEATEEQSAVDRLLGLVNVARPKSAVDIEHFARADAVADAGDEMMTAAIRVFLDSVAKSSKAVERIDKNVIDEYIAELDRVLSDQLDEILHHEKFQQLESAWRGLHFLVERTNFRSNIKIEMLNVSKQELQEDFEDVPEPVLSGLYEHVYNQEYDTPGGEPVGAMIANYEFDASAPDLTLLQNISKVAAAGHCPFIAAAAPNFFGLDSYEELNSIPDVAPIFETGKYAKWRAFRESEDSRYIGLTMPRFALRLPYDPENNPVKGFNYQEDVKAKEHDKYLWGNASFAMAANMTRSFASNGWCVQIRGPESGGIVQDLALHTYEANGQEQVKVPTETIITDRREYELSEAGFIPMSWYKNTNDACFFGANSTQKPAVYSVGTEDMSAEEATANSRLCSRLPYIMLVSRLTHYLKAIQRQNIGGYKDRATLQQDLQNWINRLVTGTPNPSPRVIAEKPLKEAKIVVEDIEENPGFFNVQIYVRPHIQLEGMDIGLSIVSQMPKSK